MATPKSAPDAMSQNEALKTLGLSGDADAEAVRAAFRGRVHQADPARHNGCDARLRRLILARDSLIKSLKISTEAPEFTSLFSQDFALSISLDIALHGGTAPIEIPAIGHMDASVISLTQTLRLHVLAPPGLRDGDRARLPTREGGWVEARITIHTPPSIHVWGDDIWMSASLAPHVLRLGGAFVIDTPHGTKPLRLAPGASDGASLRLKGLGLPATDTAAAGDLIVRLQAQAGAAPASPHMLSTFRQRWAS